jgi:hypothetical protein
VTRRYWWQDNNNTDREITMGLEWSGRPKTVRPVPPIGEAAHDDFVAQETARAEEIRKHDREEFGKALVRFTQRVAALPELGGALATDQQFTELDAIDAIWAEVLTRRAVLRSRTRGNVGLFQQTTGQPLPPFTTQGTTASAEAYAARMDDETCENGEGGQ